MLFASISNNGTKSQRRRSFVFIWRWRSTNGRCSKDNRFSGQKYLDFVIFTAVIDFTSNFGLETNTSNEPSDSKLIDDSEIEIIPETLPEEIFEENNNSNSED